MEVRAALIAGILGTTMSLISIIMHIGSDRQREAPKEADKTKRLVCFDVKILDVTDTTSLLEVQSSNEVKNRMLRDGKFGNVGDVFSFCEEV